jgi:hypothetical protein
MHRPTGRQLSHTITRIEASLDDHCSTWCHMSMCTHGVAFPKRTHYLPLTKNNGLTL